MYHINRFVAIPPMFLYFCNMQRFAFFFLYLFSLIIFAVALSNISSFWTTKKKFVPLRLIQKYFIEQAPDTKSHDSTWSCKNRIFHFLLLNYQQFFSLNFFVFAKYTVLWIILLSPAKRWIIFEKFVAWLFQLVMYSNDLYSSICQTSFSYVKESWSHLF